MKTDSGIVHPRYRADIDGLRAVAVLSVIAFHLFPDAVPGGFTGVDVFFVISGFLISSIIFESLERDVFSYTEFYKRRIRRIFPALIIVIAATYAAGWFLLLANEFNLLGRHIAFSSFFASNFLLMSESGYFDTAAESKPLLHLWSLGVEEQFYIIWPLLAVIASRRKFYIPLLIALIAGMSFALNIGSVETNAISAFYLPFPRLWEFLIGAALAWRRVKDNSKHAAALSVLGSVLLIAALVLINREKAFPGYWALLPVLGAAALIAAGPQAVLNRKFLSHPFAVWIGGISYPLYLWHWPFIAYAHLVAGEVLPLNLCLFILAASVICAWLTSWLIEKPLRFGGAANVKTGALVTAMAVLCWIGCDAAQNENNTRNRPMDISTKLFADALRWQHYDSATIEKCMKKYNLAPCAESGADPGIMILGNSHGIHLLHGLSQVMKEAILVMNMCPPLLDIDVRFSHSKGAVSCLQKDYLRMNLDYLKKTPRIKTVILATHWRPLMDGRFCSRYERNYMGDLSLVSAHVKEQAESSVHKVYFGLSRTVDALLGMNKTVVLIRDTPDIFVKLEDFCLDRIAMKVKRNCTIPRQQFMENRANEDWMIRALQQDYPALKIFDPIDTFCDKEFCYLIRDGVTYYRDQHHLSDEGSKLIGHQISEWMKH